MNKLSYLLILIFLAACANQAKVSTNESSSTEPFVIYKTKANYFNKVPVTLSSDKTVIVSYPAPSDLKKDGVLSLPTALKDGYLIDNRGIGLNVAFTSYTYTEYVALKELPSSEEFFERMIDEDPLLELYDCKNNLKIKNNVDKVNKLVAKKFRNCVRVK